MFSLQGSNFVALDSVPVFSSAVLHASTMGDLALQLEVIDLFQEQFGNPAALFGGLRNDRDWRFAAHALRGGAAAIGALEVASLATMMEEQGMPAEVADCGNAIRTLADAMARYFTAVASLTCPEGAAA